MSDIDQATEAARALLEQARQRRINECAAAIAAALDQYQCNLDAVTVIRGGQIETQITIVAR